MEIKRNLKDYVYEFFLSRKRQVKLELYVYTLQNIKKMWNIGNSFTVICIIYLYEIASLLVFNIGTWGINYDNSMNTKFKKHGMPYITPHTNYIQKSIFLYKCSLLKWFHINIENAHNQNKNKTNHWYFNNGSQCRNGIKPSISCNSKATWLPNCLQNHIMQRQS